MSSKSRQLSNTSNRLSVADRATLLTKIGTREGELIWQADIGLGYQWTTPQLVNNNGTIINITGDTTGSWVASYSGAIMLDWWDIDKTGVEDISDSFQSALDVNGSKIISISNSDSSLMVKKQLRVPSNTTIDLNGATLYWRGTGTFGGRGGAVFEMHGVDEAAVSTIAGVNVGEHDYLLPVTDSSIFRDNDYIRAEQINDTLTNTSYGYLVKIRIVTSSQLLATNYNIGYSLVNKDMRYTQIKVVDNVTIRNIKFIDVSINTSISEDISLCSFINAVSCSVENVDGLSTNNPLVYTRYTQSINLNRVRLVKPRDVGGGKGYLVQYNSSLYCEAKNLRAEKERHLVDFTMSGHCYVSNCHSTTSDNATYNTHGSYEHDISFTDVVGSFGVAGAQGFGDSAKRITITNLTGAYIVSLHGSESLVLTNCTVQFLNVNTNGLIIDNVHTFTAPGYTETFKIDNFSRSFSKPFSSIPAIIKNSTILSRSGNSFMGDNMADDVVIIENCKVTLRQEDLSNGEMHLHNCTIYNGSGATSLGLSRTKFKAYNSTFESIGFRLNSNSIGHLEFYECEFSGANSSSAVVGVRDKVASGNDVLVKIVDCINNTTDTHFLEGLDYSPQNENVNIVFKGNKVNGGNVKMADRTAGYVISSENIFASGVTYAFGTAGAKRIDSNNIQY